VDAIPAGRRIHTPDVRTLAREEKRLCWELGLLAIETFFVDKNCGWTTFCSRE